jgi:hypothetical protein
MRGQGILEMFAKNPDKKVFMQMALKNLDGVLPENAKFMDTLMTVQCNKLLSDLGFTGSMAGSPRTLLQRYLLNPGGMLRGYSAIKSLTRLGGALDNPAGNAIAKFMTNPKTIAGMKQAGISAGARSLNSILYGK